MKKASEDTTDTEESYHDTPPPPDTPPPYYGSVPYELSEHGSFSDPRRFSVGLLQEAGYLDENLQRCKRLRADSPVPFAGPDASAPPDLEPATSFAELRRRAELANKKVAAEAEAAAAAAAFEQKPAVADSEVCVPTSDTPPHPADRRFPSTGGGATLAIHPELGGEEGHYQTVWRRSTAVNEFGMALFVPKPEPSSAHGGSGRHTIKIDHDPPSPVAVRFEPEK